MNNHNDSIGNRKCGLPTGNAVPQPTAPLRATGIQQHASIIVRAEPGFTVIKGKEQIGSL